MNFIDICNKHKNKLKVYIFNFFSTLYKGKKSYEF